MTDHTTIAWTTHTWNPWQGCTRVSPGCAHCYMFTQKARYGQDPATVVRSAPPTFTRPLRWHEPARVFTCSWSDWFHADADAWRDEAWDIIRRTPHLTYQILTKRPERIADHLPADWGAGWPNVWLGVSIENQRHAFRAALLAGIPATVRFVSAEPLLGPLDLTELHPSRRPDYHGAREIVPLHWLHWVIVGGESGPDHRPMDLAWAASLQRQCAGHGVAFFFKQRSGPRSELTDGVPPELLVQEFPQRAPTIAHQNH